MVQLSSEPDLIIAEDRFLAVAVVFPDFVRFYSFANGDEEAPVEEDMPHCIAPTTRVTRD